MARFFNRVAVRTATVGQGTLVLGLAVTKFLTPAQAGAVDGDDPYFLIEEGSDFEISQGVLGTGLTTLTRATVVVSKIAGIVDTAKMSLAGTATVRIIETAEQLAAIIRADDYSAQSILLSIADNTPLPLVIGPSQLVGRKATGDAGVLSEAEVREVLDIEPGTFSDLAAGFQQLGAAAIIRSWRDKAREGFSVLDFGAIRDDATENRTPWQDCLDEMNNQGGGVIKVPRGTYYFEDDTPLDPGTANIAFIGEGGGVSVLHYDEGIDALPHYLFKNIANVAKGHLLFEKLGFHGTFNGNEATRGGNPLWLDYYLSATLRDCEFKEIANTAMDFHFLGRFICANSRFKDIARDAIRCRDTPNQLVDGNYILRNGDDAIALHTADSAIGQWPTREGIIVRGNHLVNTGCMRIIAGRMAHILANRMQFPNGAGITLHRVAAEGNLPQFDILVKDNIINDLIHVIDATPETLLAGAINIIGLTPRGSVGTNSTIPGRWDATAGAFIFPWDHVDDDTTGTTNPVAPMPGIKVLDNIIARRHPDAAAFSDYGFGNILRPGPALDPAIDTAALRHNAGILIAGGLRGADISRNQIEHFAVGIQFEAPTTDFDYTGVVVGYNNILNCIHRPIYIVSGSFSAGIRYIGNIINGDPYRQYSNSNVDGTYDADGLPGAYNFGNVKGVEVIGGSVANCAAVLVSNVPASIVVRDVVLYAGAPTAIGFNAANKGIGNIPRAGESYRYHIINADPTSATYLQEVTTQPVEASAMPSSGTFVAGAFVRNSNPSAAAGIVGWLRVTTGTGHVLDTDWVVIGVSAFMRTVLDDTSALLALATLGIATITDWSGSGPGITFVTPGDLNVVYSNRLGKIISIGKLRIITGLIQTSTFTHTTAAGAFKITGLIDAQNTNFQGAGPVSMRYTKANFTQLNLETSLNTFFYVMASGSGQVPTELTTVEVPSGTQLSIQFVGFYTVA